MNKIKSFKDLDAWILSKDLAVRIYKITDEFPKNEQFGLASQMRRCSVSVPSNIAEGFNRFSIKDKLNFYYVALASAAELQNQIIIAAEIGYLRKSTSIQLEIDIESIHKIITGLIKSTKTRL